MALRETSIDSTAVVTSATNKRMNKSMSGIENVNGKCPAIFATGKSKHGIKELGVLFREDKLLIKNDPEIANGCKEDKAKEVSRSCDLTIYFFQPLPAIRIVWWRR